MNNKPLYHKSSQAFYFDNGDGSLEVLDYKGNNRASGAPNTLAWTKNDKDGWDFIAKLKVKMGVTKFNYLYRCPRSGIYGGFSRTGNVGKKRGKVISVRP